jgi:hypothetical protein
MMHLEDTCSELWFNSVSDDADSTVTTRLLLHHKFTSLHSSAFVGLFKNFTSVISAWNTEYTKHMDTLFWDLVINMFNLTSSGEKKIVL